MKPHERVIVKAVKAQWGEAAIRRGSKHLVVYPPTGRPIAIPGSPSDHRSLKNCHAQLRRAGLKI